MIVKDNYAISIPVLWGIAGVNFELLMTWPKAQAQFLIMDQEF